MIVVNCTHCQGPMKVDETKLQTGRKGLIRCPHCDETFAVDPERLGKVDLESMTGRSLESDGEHQEKTTSPRTEPSSDGPVQFPAEEQTRPEKKKSRSIGARLLIWTVISLAVVGFFALLVNLILPGPPDPKNIPSVTQPPSPTVDSPVQHPQAPEPRLPGLPESMKR